MNDRKMVLDGMMGLVVGDALGCPVSTERSFGSVEPSPKWRATALYNIFKGTWIDDSSSGTTPREHQRKERHRPARYHGTLSRLGISWRIYPLRRGV